MHGMGWTWNDVKRMQRAYNETTRIGRITLKDFNGFVDERCDRYSFVPAGSILCALTSMLTLIKSCPTKIFDEDHVE